MRNTLFYQALLLGAVALTGCSSGGDEVLTEMQPPNLQQEWTAFAIATNDSIEEVSDSMGAVTRAVFYGGNSRKFATLWDTGDEVKVYKSGGESPVGTMTPTEYGVLSTTLTGTLTGPFVQDEVLDLYLPSRAMNFTGQKGTIYGLSSNFSFQHTTAIVEAAADNILTLSDVNPDHRQEYLRFVLTNEAGTERLHPSQLDIEVVSGGHIVESVADNGTVTPCDLLTINPDKEEGEYPGELLVAMLNDANAAVTYRIKAYVDDKVYVGPIANLDGENVFSRNSRDYLGKLTRIRRKMRLTTAASTLTVDAITDQTFTGSAIEPVVTVRDGETVLTQGTDYSVAYSDNTAGGTATVTITGLADAGATAATKYLGTQSTTFNIVQATPVITMAESTLTLIASEGEGHTGSVAVSSIMVGELDVSEWVDISYSSSNASIASVAADGTVTGAGHGNATITVTATPKTAYAGNINTATTTFNVVVSEKAGVSSTIGSWGDGGTENPDVKF